MGERFLMHDDVKEILFTQEQIRDCVHEMGAQITRDYSGKDDLVVVSVLRGAAIFMADLVREIQLPLEMDFMAVSSYGSAAQTSGVVKIVKDLDTPIEGKHVIIAEDILDSGLTLERVVKMLAERNPASIEVAAFLRKTGAQRVDVDCKYIGFECPNDYVVGYGLDFAQRYRNLPYVGVLKPEIYQ